MERADHGHHADTSSCSLLMEIVLTYRAEPDQGIRRVTQTHPTATKELTYSNYIKIAIEIW